MDSNHDKELQRLLCYHYTTGHDRHKLASGLWQRKRKSGRQGNPKTEIREPKEGRTPKSEEGWIRRFA